MPELVTNSHNPSSPDPAEGVFANEFLTLSFIGFRGTGACHSGCPECALDSECPLTITFVVILIRRSDSVSMLI